MTSHRPVITDTLLLVVLVVALAAIAVWLLWGAEQQLMQQIGDALNRATAGGGR